MEEAKTCAVCEAVTVHYDGACERCLARKQAEQNRDRAQPPQAPPPTTQPEQVVYNQGATYGRQFTNAIVIVLLLFLIVIIYSKACGAH